MSVRQPARRTADPVWQTIRDEAAGEVGREPILASFLHATILNHDSLEDALSFRLAGKLGSPSLSTMLIREVMDEAMRDCPDIGRAARIDIRAVHDRDPACGALSEPLLYRKGFHALESFRVSHWLWGRGRRALALHLQNRISQVFGADIHPAASIGTGVFIDHATGVVIGGTAVVEDNVSMLHEVTLGGTGKESGDRHPKIRRGVLLGVGAKILGNVEVGEGAKVGAGSVVLSNVPPHCTAVGVPAKIIGTVETDQPALEMDHRLPLDYSI
jgi:serine O-acetyltransferase